MEKQISPLHPAPTFGPHFQHLATDHGGDIMPTSHPAAREARELAGGEIDEAANGSAAAGLDA